MGRDGWWWSRRNPTGRPHTGQHALWGSTYHGCVSCSKTRQQLTQRLRALPGLCKTTTSSSSWLFWTDRQDRQFGRHEMRHCMMGKTGNTLLSTSSQFSHFVGSTHTRRSYLVARGAWLIPGSSISSSWHAGWQLALCTRIACAGCMHGMALYLSSGSLWFL